MTDSNLLTSSVPRSLEAKSKIFGLELSDILILFLNLSLENLIFGSTSFKYLMVYGSTLSIGFILFFVKRGKPDSYLQHLGEYITSASVRYAGLNDRFYRNLKKEV
jgi:hypothetical protein